MPDKAEKQGRKRGITVGKATCEMRKEKNNKKIVKICLKRVLKLSAALVYNAPLFFMQSRGFLPRFRMSPAYPPRAFIVKIVEEAHV